jgi:hypothetical protein
MGPFEGLDRRRGGHDGAADRVDDVATLRHTSASPPANPCTS